MLTTAYPNNFDYSDESSFSHSTQPLFAFDDPWSVGHYEMSVPHDTLPGQTMDGLDAFGEITDDNFLSDDFSSSDVITDDEVGSTPPPSSPSHYMSPSDQYNQCNQYNQYNYQPKTESFAEQSYEIKAEMEFPTQLAQNNYQQRQLYLQYQQYQYQVLQQKLYMSALPPISHIYCHPSTSVTPVPDPARGLSIPTEMAVPREVRPYEDRQHPSDTPIKLTSLDTSHFGNNITPYPKLKSIPLDISGNLTDAQYNKIFKKYHLHLQLDSHPTMTEQDLEDIKLHGRMYFLKNVKTIVPKVGPWKFNAHISHRRSDERQYNIPGMAVTCKVKEWLTDDGLWRLYHYKRGKTVKVKK